MTCSHCVSRVEQVLTAVSDGSAVIVGLEPATAEIDCDAMRRSPRELIEAVPTTGYDAKVSV